MNSALRSNDSSIPWFVGAGEFSVILLRLKRLFAPRLRHALGWLRFHVGYRVFLIGRAAAWLGRLAAMWWRTRQLRYLLQGLPALLALGAVVACCCAWQFSTVHTAVAYYRTTAESAVKTADYKTAQLAYERLLALEGDSLEHRFQLGKVLHALGDPVRAQVLLESAAPSDRLGYPLAHYNRALQLLGKQHPTAVDLHAAEMHLLRAIQGQPDALGAHAMLGQFYVKVGQSEKAEEHLRKASEVHKELLLMLAQVCAQQGKRDLADSYARQAVGFFQKATEDNLDKPQLRLGWAESLMVLREHDKAAEVVLQGWRITHAPVYQGAAGVAFAFWSDQFPDDPGRRLEILEQGLRIDPNHPELLQRLINLTRIDGTSPARAKARSALEDLLARGKGTAFLHLALGVDAYQHGDLDEAENHLNIAFELDPGMPAIANNLAYMIAHGKQPDLPHALKLVNSALQRVPDNLQMRETRGQILVKMGRWKEALTDLSAALRILSTSPVLHQALAECYSHLNMSSLARRHQQIAEELGKKQRPP
jgi:tetratricopeptide (TPR) repeat protein